MSGGQLTTFISSGRLTTVLVHALSSLTHSAPRGPPASSFLARCRADDASDKHAYVFYNIRTCARCSVFICKALEVCSPQLKNLPTGLTYLHNAPWGPRGRAPALDTHNSEAGRLSRWLSGLVVLRSLALFLFVCKELAARKPDDRVYAKAYSHEGAGEVVTCRSRRIS